MICFLDMDGVLVDFNEGTHRVFGKKYDYSQLSSKWNYFEEWGLTFQEFDAVCTIDFWAGLRWFHDGKDILSLVEDKFSPKNIYLLSCPMPNPGSATGKMLWVERHLPKYKKRLIITQTPKELFAAPDRVLIDDKNENIDQFCIYGGRGILVPRPWNRAASNKTIPNLQVILGAINVQSSCDR